MMRLIVPALGLSFLGAAELRTDYSRERVLRVASTVDLSTETTRSEMTRDGQPVDSRFGGGGGATKTKTELVHTDEVLAQADGRPTKVRRSFVTATSSSSSERGEREQSSPIEGVVVELEVDEDGDVDAKVVEGTAPEGEMLEELEPTLALDALLPEGEVAEGESWELDDEAIERALGFALARRLFPPPSFDGEGGERRRRGGNYQERGQRGQRGGMMGPRSLAGLDWEGKATFAAETAEHEGVACRVVLLELEGSGDGAPEGGGGFGGSVESSYEVRLEGRLLFSEELARPVLLELEGKLSHEMEMERESPQGGSFTMSRASEGEIELRTTISEE